MKSKEKNDEVWDSGIEDDLKFYHQWCIDFFADQVLEMEDEFQIDAGPYKIKMKRCPVFEEIFKEPKYQINVEIGAPNVEGTRWFVGIYYKKSDDEWILINKETPNSYFILKGKGNDGD